MKAFVLLTHQRPDDHREHDHNGYQHDELKQRFHESMILRPGALIAGVRQSLE
jgi:hypothetical protein